MPSTPSHTLSSGAAPLTPTPSTSPAPSILPGLALALGVAVVSMLVAPLLPGISALVLAIVVGVVLANVVPLPRAAAPGLAIASKKLLRGGIVLLGRLVGVGRHLTVLIACGFSICGAAAVAAAAGVTDPDDEREEDTVTAVALVVLCGSLMIVLVPAAAALMGLHGETAGLWAGASIHEVAQVVAAGGAIGGGAALTVAVIVKLARVLMLAPVMAVMSMQQRRHGAKDGKQPPLVQLFVVGFLAMVLVRSFVPLPEPVLEAGSLLQTLLLAAAMFALGTGVRISLLKQVGPRPFLLAALSTALVASVALGGVLLVA